MDLTKTITHAGPTKATQSLRAEADQVQTDVSVALPKLKAQWAAAQNGPGSISDFKPANP